MITSVLLFSCQAEEKLFNDVNEIAEFDTVYKPILIQSGKESGTLESIMKYSIFSIDSLGFQNLESSVIKSNKFKEGKYYLNIELDDYLNKNKLSIINMSKCSITKNKYDKTYNLYLLSDKNTFVICQINH